MRKTFGELVALDDISLDVEEKAITILIGPNGSGKTTLINTVCGFYKPDGGKVLLNERDITALPPHKIYRHGIGRTFQIPSLFPNLTVLENMLIAESGNPGEGYVRSLFKGRWEDSETKSAEKAARILNMLSLSDKWDQLATGLSGGQLKLVEIGRALMTNAKILMLDEPISGVNPTLAHEIFSRLVSLRNEMGLTFLIIEHRLDIALRYVDQVHAMARGRLIASGRPEEVMVDSKVIESYLGA